MIPFFYFLFYLSVKYILSILLRKTNIVIDDSDPKSPNEAQKRWEEESCLLYFPFKTFFGCDTKNTLNKTLKIKKFTYILTVKIFKKMSIGKKKKFTENFIF